MSTIQQGYKQTEVGVIPKDWVVKPIQEFSDSVRGGSPRPAGDPRFFNGAYIPWLTVAALTNIPASQLVVNETAACLTEEGSTRSRTLLPGTLIIANSGATLGVAKVLGIKCCANDGIAALLNVDRDVSVEYLAHFINTKTTYLREVVATGNGQPNLNTGLIGAFSLPLPPTKAEQEAIAEALSDADALIESLQQLVAKKRHIKQGTMQELLTGKKRLPGFSGKWEVKRLGDVAQLKNGYAFQSRTYSDLGQFQIVTIANVQDGFMTVEECNKVVALPDDIQGHQKLRFGDILISMTGNVGRVCQVSNDDCLLNQRVGKLVPTAIDSDLFFFLLSQRCFLTSMAIKATGGAQGNLSKADITEYELSIPNDAAEQTAIANVLSDMDAEIAELETQLAKTRTLKQGMMHKLLTGEIRLL